jgi:2-iminobutanoate/2-iminopropanoate deaminase
MERSFIAGTWQKQRAFSPAVTTRGGRTVWVAGHGIHQDPSGKTLAGDFDAQVHATFAALEETLARSGAALRDIVTMTVFIIDARLGDRFTELRAGYFPDGNFPVSALITVAGFAKPEMMLEIQCIAVVDD